MSQQTWQFPKPSKSVTALLVGILALWIGFAVAVNWVAFGQQGYNLLIGNSALVLRGQIWRLVTAGAVHLVSGRGAVTHVLFTLLMLYFFAPPLEAKWGFRRLMFFLMGSAAFAFSFETLMFLVFPSVAQATWHGGMVMVDAAVVAWAMGARGQVVRLYFVIPLKPMTMVALMVFYNLLVLFAAGGSPEGMFAPFAAMAAGYLFCDESPARNAYLKWRLSRIESQITSMKDKRRKQASHLRVIQGGGSGGAGPDDDDTPSGRILH